MANMNGGIIITRPLEESKLLADALIAMGYRCHIDPMLTIQPLGLAQQQLRELSAREFQAIVLTSQHALEAVRLPGEWLTLPIFAVGMKTARAARRTGFVSVHAGVGGVEHLVPVIARFCQPRSGQLLYLRGQRISQPLQPLLPDYNIREIITYRSQASVSLSAESQQAIRKNEAGSVMFFSRHSALSFEQAADGLSLASLTALCISDNVASALASAKWKQVCVAAQPSVPAMIALLQQAG